MIEVGRRYLVNGASVAVLYHRVRLRRVACLEGLIWVLRPISRQGCQFRAAGWVILERHVFRSWSAGRTRPRLRQDGGTRLVRALGLASSPEVKACCEKKSDYEERNDDSNGNIRVALGSIGVQIHG